MIIASAGVKGTICSYSDNKPFGHPCGAGEKALEKIFVLKYRVWLGFGAVRRSRYFIENQCGHDTALVFVFPGDGRTRAG